MRSALAYLLVVAATAAFAHGGGLDSNGCHNDRKNGGYHCHRGPMAGNAFSSKQEMLGAMQKGGAQSDSTKPGKK